jgi:hypothetical protein
MQSHVTANVRTQASPKATRPIKRGDYESVENMTLEL